MQRQVVWAAGFGVGAAHAEAAEGLDAYEGSCDAAVEVDVARFELPTGAFQMVAVFGVDAAGEAVGTVVGDVEGFVEVAGLYHGEDGAEDLLARHRGVPVDLEDGRADEVAVVGVAWVLTEDALAFLLARIHVNRHLFELGLAYHGSYVHLGALGTPDLEGFRFLHDLV